MMLIREIEELEKNAKKKQKAINRASYLIEDARARYIKEKTRAKTKKAALEKDAILKSHRFDVLSDYERFEDIQEAYGMDCITSKERDRLENLWEERENIINHTEDGYYKDLVTEALHEAWVHIQNLWDDEIENAKVARNAYEKERAEADKAYWDIINEERRAAHNKNV